MQKTNLLDTSDLKINNREILINEFKKPIFQNKLFINKNFLITNSRNYELNKESWIRNPQNFALELYGEFEYYRVILLVNNIGSYIQFIPSNLKNNHVIVPYQSYIDKLLKN